MAAITHEVARQNAQMQDRIDLLTEQNTQLVETVSRLDKALRDLSNTFLLAASSKSSTRSTFQELINGVVHDLVTFVETAGRQDTRTIRTINGDILAHGADIGLVYHNFITEDEEEDDPDEDILEAVSED
jgi:hypothetical protein